jgi:hypothetical protein
MSNLARSHPPERHGGRRPTVHLPCPNALRGAVGTIEDMASTTTEPRKPRRPSAQVDKYVVVMEFAWDNGVEVVEVSATNPGEARRRARASVLGDDDEDDSGSNIRHTWVVRGTLT